MKIFYTLWVIDALIFIISAVLQAEMSDDEFPQFMLWTKLAFAFSGLAFPFFCAAFTIAFIWGFVE